MTPLSPEEKRSNAAALLASADGRLVQMQWRQCHFEGMTLPWDKKLTDEWDVADFVYRPAPEPEPPRAWTFNTRPKELIWVYRKGFITDRLIIAWRDDGVEIAGGGHVSYGQLLSHWLQRDGSPCGTCLKEPKP